MNTKKVILKNKDLESLFFTGLKVIIISTILLFTYACSNEDDCAYGTLNQCPELGLNIGEACDASGQGVLNGTVTEDCECIEIFPVIRTCPGFIQNGDFEIVIGNPNATVDEDIDLATSWKPLWQSGSLADLFNGATTSFGSSSFAAPTPLSGVFAGMWIENSTSSNASYREGMFNELTAPINANTGNYTLTFDYANMSESNASNAIKIGVYGVYHPISGTLPATPTGINTPTNLDLFGSTNTVFLGEITITSSTTNAWTTATFTIDSSTLIIPATGINHIMITNSHIPFPDYGKMYVGLDNFCLIN